MKKTMILIVSFAVLTISLSAFVDKRRNARIGSEAPALILERTDSTVVLERLQGKRVILSFWSASDAQSRMMQNRISTLVKSDASTCDGVEILSVNFDRSEPLMKEIIRLDNLDESSQFHVGSPDVASAIRDAFAMTNGLRTFIIDETGRIVIADPTEEDLKTILRRA